MPKTEEKPVSRALDKKFAKQMSDAESLLNDLNIALFGTDNTDEVSALNDRFNAIMKTEIDAITKGNKEDFTSFLNKLYSNDSKENAFDKKIDREFLSMGMEGSDATLASMLTDVYQNKILKQSDIHEVSSQLIELREALSTMRDAVVSPDVNTGRINRNISFGNRNSDKNEYYTGMIENVEEKLDLHKKIKDFIVLNALEQGNHYAYTIPYADLFNKFMQHKDEYDATKLYDFHESAEEKAKIESIYSLGSDNDMKAFCESCYEKYSNDREMKSLGYSTIEYRKAFTEDVSNIMDRISIVTDPIPIPIMEEGMGAIQEFRETFVNESGDAFMEKKNDPFEASNNKFIEHMKKDMASDGIYMNMPGSSKKKGDKFNDIKDCYIKMMSGMQLLPITIMSEEIGYFYIVADEATPLSGLVSGTLSFAKMDDTRREHSLVGDIAARIVSKFDKKFLKENPKFKKVIIEAIEYYDLNERKIRFQFIPKEYIFPFKVNVDENGHGTSMLEGSLFYAKLYLMLLLFKIMTIITNSNDTKVNYIRQSGIDKNLTNMVQEIAMQKQARKINMMDLFSYTTLLNKVGNGTEMYIPVGRNGDHPLETEILQGQEVQLNTELMELLRNSYILGTGVPSAIMNYLNEADFAKSIETAHSKFNGRVINYQLDLNPAITKWYRAILEWTTNIPIDVIQEIEISLPAPKTNSNAVKAELIQNVQSLSEFLVQIYYGEDKDPKLEKEITSFKKEIARKYLPINFDEIDELFEENKKKSVGKALEVSPEEDTENLLNGI